MMQHRFQSLRLESAVLRQSAPGLINSKRRSGILPKDLATQKHRQHRFCTQLMKSRGLDPKNHVCPSDAAALLHILLGCAGATGANLTKEAMFDPLSSRLRVPR